MTQTSTKERKILITAAAVGLGVGILAALLFSFALAAAGILALIIAIGVAVALWMRSTDPTTETSLGAETSSAAKVGNDRPAAPAQTARADTATPEPVAVPAQDTPAPAAEARPEPEPAERSDAEQGLVKPSARLAGQDDLASRKGTWRYRNDGASQVDAMPDADTGPQAHPGADGTSEAEARNDVSDPADKPQMLSAPREGGADDLLRIKGIGPKLEGALHEMGVFHYDQIASWQDREVIWMDNNLTGFKGRVSRDDWVGQAKALAANRMA